MSVYQHRGKFEIKWFRKIASTAIAANSFVAESVDVDTVQAAVATNTSLVGICMKKIASTDSDFADNTRIPVAVPLDTSSEMMCDTASTIAVTDEGEHHDLTDAVTVNQAATTTKVLKLKQFVSATKGIYTMHKKSFV